MENTETSHLVYMSVKEKKELQSAASTQKQSLSGFLLKAGLDRAREGKNDSKSK